MPGYFNHFPLVEYSGFKLKDITKRADVSETILGLPYVYMPYTIKDNERAEDVAYYYYDDPELVWLVNLSNKIIDPYYEWPLNSQEFDKVLIERYSDKSGLTGFDVLTWSLNTTITENIVHAVSTEDSAISINTFTYLNLSPQDQIFWSPLRVYDYETELNESKRIIYLVNKIYAKQAEKELRSLFNG